MLILLQDQAVTLHPIKMYCEQPNMPVDNMGSCLNCVNGTSYLPDRIDFTINGIV